jgi:LysM repeat protein
MRKILVCLFVLFVLSACGNNVTAVPDLATLDPYKTTTPSLTDTVIPVLTEILLPTPTIFTYTVVQGDTLSGIAQRYNVTLEALLAANPGVQPTALSVGAKLVIPSGNVVSGEPSPTPAAVPVLQARCWPESTGGLWCFALLQNTYAETLENLSAQFTLLDSNGQVLANQVTYGLLDTLPPGASLPLAVHFPPPVPAEARPRVQLLTSIRLLPGDKRYLPAAVQNTLVSVDATARTAQVSGQILLTGDGTANTMWVLATAYDAAGNVVGVRRWDSTSPLSAGTPLQFNFQLFSLGPGIARVEFLAEARP